MSFCQNRKSVRERNGLSQEEKKRKKRKMQINQKTKIWTKKITMHNNTTSMN